MKERRLEIVPARRFARETQRYSAQQGKSALVIWGRSWNDPAQAVHYLNGAKANFGTDQAKYLHELSEAYAFILNLKYAPNETRVLTQAEVSDLLENTIGDNFWTVVEADLDSAISFLEGKYNL